MSRATRMIYRLLGAVEFVADAYEWSKRVYRAIRPKPERVTPVPLTQRCPVSPAPGPASDRGRPR